MFRNYIKIALRSLVKNKGYSFLNIFGLALGVSCFVLIFLFIHDELSYDRYHKKADRIYRVCEKLDPAENSSSQPFSLAPTLLTDYPDLVEHAVRFFNFQAPSLTLDNGPERRFNERRLFFVDSTVFRIFDWKFLQGGPETALDAPNKIVITEAMAQKYFGGEQPLGKVLRYEDTLDLTVSAVVQNTPFNSHFEYDFLVSWSTLRGMFGNEPRGWYWNPAWTYLLLAENANPADLEAQFPDFIEKYFPQNIKDKVTVYLQPLTDIHLKSRLDFEIGPNSDIMYVYIFSVIAIFVLLIACINFMNLATARSAKRAREVGMRKVLGAYRGQLIKQFLGESIVVSTISVIIAIPMVILALPYLNAFVQKSMRFDPLGIPLLGVSLVLVALAVGLAAGIYPALFLSAFRPIMVLKGKLHLGKINITEIVRRTLVVAQFAISIILIIGTIIAYNQLNYLQEANLGFDKTHVLMVNMQRTNMPGRLNEVKPQLVQHPNISAVTTSELVLGSSYQTHTYTPQGETEAQQFQRLIVSRDFVKTMDLQLLAGRDFSEDFLTDDSMAVIINETMVKHLGWETPQQAIGKVLSPVGSRQQHRVIGVLADFNYSSLHNPIAPFILDMADTPRQRNFFNRYLTIRISASHPAETIDFLRERWHELVPNRPFEFFFLDQDIDKLYRAEQRLGGIAGLFSIFAICVACLGLFGLASYTAEQRTKEIGIRKVMGASPLSIFLNLSKDFLRLVAIGVLVAWPVAFFAAQTWLRGFAFRADIAATPFVVAGLIACGIAWLTVGTQAARAASTNPVHALKYE